MSDNDGGVVTAKDLEVDRLRAEVARLQAVLTENRMLRLRLHEYTRADKYSKTCLNCGQLSAKLERTEGELNRITSKLYEIVEPVE